MKDRNGKTLKTGDPIMYYIDGGIDDSSLDTLMVHSISYDKKYVEAYEQEHTGPVETPFVMASLLNNGEVIDAPFFSYELRKLGIEELI